ncbi:Putrescine transport ATP-binding protein PotG [Candidatus Promineifilum breve]|uniref:ABC-type quaternary amine transporter n=1 Tax=Candidatus Promineifilum breve TaxID=1806508 RepID=A0A161JML4_9CHLR|nr:ABC transporter ATP-binding protein [Candidatus Promineifilum breve]CUS05303.2 Putrescine transport ATP-binding protein PotG [Candidatus Promineifilum breve]
MALLEVDRVSKSFNAALAAVRDVSLTLARGEILCLLGPSGCGKTTLLRLIAGLEQPDAGRIRFDGRDLAGVPPHERGFGMMFQDFALFPHQNVQQNVAFGLRMQRRPAAAIAERVTEMLELVGLAALADRDIARLSGGEQQRVALARALAPGPALLMLDEPLGALDRALRERLMLDVRDILKRLGMTAVYVTHDQTEAFAVGDRVAVMNAGQVVQIGPPQAVHERPATPFVAQFLGYQNLLPGRVVADGLVETAVGCFRPAGPPAVAGQAVALLIKPVMAAAGRGSAAPECNVINGTVAAVTFRGRFSQVWVMVAGERLLFEEPGDPPYAPGDAIWLTIAPEQLLLYESSPNSGAHS